ncbi:MAG TPA: hypothetical protein VIM73_14920 [Polyangiaceae bacterium]
MSRARRSGATFGLLFGLLALACSSESLEADEPGAGQENRPAQVAAALLPESAGLIALYDAPDRWSATALAFNPLVPGELWTTLRQFPQDAPCTQSVRTGCAALEGQVAILTGADTAAPSAVLKKDYNAWHFMRRPTGIAFGDNGNLATCSEARTGNFDDDVVDYNGPVLWSSDPAIFGVRPVGDQNGTHLDMLHSTPFCMGIAHEVENVYWTFNGQLGALDRYDFNEPHEIGGEDHTDGELLRYLEGELRRTPEVPSQLVLDRAKGFLYAADTGNARVVRLDITTGQPGANVPEYDGMPVHRRMDGAELTVLVADGALTLPSGLALHDDVLLVTDNASGRIHAFDMAGQELRSFDTGLGANALSGIAVGPDGVVYLSALSTGQVFRVEAP